MGERLFIVAAAGLSAVLVWPVMTPALARVAGGEVQAGRTQEREDYNSGAFLYRTFCASCHGETGRGDGPVADLSSPRPPDLTGLQRRAGGVFPRDRVRAALDGPDRPAGHAPPAMPNWRNVLRRTDGDERSVQKRLDALVAHVEWLQGGTKN